MASAEGGYECDFVSKVPEDYICVVCLHALKDPVQVADCGHRLCKPCYNQLKDDAEARYYVIMGNIILWLWCYIITNVGSIDSRNGLKTSNNIILGKIWYLNFIWVYTIKFCDCNSILLQILVQSIIAMDLKIQKI